ncbi:HIT family protein [Bradyrhizobium sp.]|jgi:diadenosine tetraphosphate (Ap4A) HIT family hydrolase|uniref:HIT family protein n=1 Tax=Bradyrhizobium sp. TaxID=376 RepID=UPI0035A089C5
MTNAKAQHAVQTTGRDACIFCALRDDARVIMRNALTFAVRDTTPVTPLHTLVLPFRHAETYFDLTDDELGAANDLLRRLRDDITKADASVEGFNIGANVGVVSGQSIFHCHIHLIPRRKGDIDNPHGGVRAVIPDKMRY